MSLQALLKDKIPEEKYLIAEALASHRKDVRRLQGCTNNIYPRNNIYSYTPMTIDGSTAGIRQTAN